MLTLHKFDFTKMAPGEEVVHVNGDTIFWMSRLDNWTELRGTSGDTLKVVETPEQITKMLE
jgi:hypothetical protein